MGQQREVDGSAQVQLLQIHSSDNVAVASMPLEAGLQIVVAGVTLVVPQEVSLGAKLAIRAIAKDSKVIKYGEPIGSATVDIKPGEYVHTHNLRSDYIATP